MSGIHAVDCWLLVWVGLHDWRSEVDSILVRLGTKSDNAHHILSQEVEGERWSLLLVHYTERERDFVVDHLRGLWRYGFVNAVAEVKD